jgi:hypothetical protein
MVRQLIRIDRDKLRAAIRNLRNESVFFMLDDAIDLLSAAKLDKIVRKYFNPKRLRLDSDKATKRDLLADVKAFEKSSLAGEYYESFDVDSKNFIEHSRGTTGWIAECHRLLGRCVEQVRTAESAEPAKLCQAFEIIFSLLDQIDECRDDIIFFADEGGAWQVGVDWERILPPWFKVLAATAAPDEYAKYITALLDHRYSRGRDKMLAVARKIATGDQRKALAEAVDRLAGRRRRGKRP